MLATNLLAASQLGGLSLAFNLIVPLAVISTGVMQAMQPVFASMNREGAGVAPLQRGIAMQIGILGLATAATAGLGPLAISLLFPASLASGADVLPLLAIGIGIWGLYSIPMNVITLVVGNVRWVWALTVGTFLAKAASLLFLLPEGDPSLVGWNFIAANVLLLSVFTAFAATSAAGRRCLAPRALAPPLGIAVTSITAVVVLVRLDLPNVVSGSAVLGVLGLQALAALALTRVRAADDAVATIARDAVGGRVGDRLESG
jgi:O-antigen/teichoic acid export membrane protein